MRSVTLVWFTLIVFMFCVQDAAAGRRGYKIALGFPFPPWDVGPLEGLNYDLLKAICEANKKMRCKIIERPYSDCIHSDADGNPVIGQALESGRVDGCGGWLITAQREQLGAEFSDPYSKGPTPQLIASNSNSAFDALGAGGSLSGANVGFNKGFFNNPACLSGNYSDFDSVLFNGDQAGVDSMTAALLGGSIDLIFWQNINDLPEGTHVVGAPVPDCGAALALVVFPVSKKRRHKSDELRRDFNCGLSLIRTSGEMANICENSSHAGGNPNCILDGPPPTVQCLADNPAD